MDTFCNFLKYFIKEQSEAKKRVINNLNYFYLQDRVNFNEITENEINLLKNYYLDNTNLIPKENIKEVYELLSNNKDLSAVIDYLYSNKLYLPLSLNMYKLISNNAKAIVIYIKEIDSKLQNKEIVSYKKEMVGTDGINHFFVYFLINIFYFHIPYSLQSEKDTHCFRLNQKVFQIHLNLY